MSSLGRFAAVFLAVILIFLFPLQYIAQIQSSNIDSIIHSHAAKFTDTARNQGAISLEMYENFINTMDYTGELYDIDMEVTHPVSGKEVDKVTLGDKIPDLHLQNTSSFTFSTQSDSNHVHTSACYVSSNTVRLTSDQNIRKIICSECNNEIGRVNWSRTTRVDNGGTHTQNYSVSSLRRSKRNNQWELVYVGTSSSYGTGASNDSKENQEELDRLRWDQATPGTIPYLYVHYILYSVIDYFDLVNLYPVFNARISSSNSNDRYYEDVPNGCPFHQHDTTPRCNQVVTAITATYPNQTVDLGGSIITTVTATYLDGHTDIVNCTSNFNPNKEGSQTVTLTYSGLVDNARTTGTKTCTLQVTVKNPVKLTSITVSPSNQSIPRYTDPSFVVTAHYDNKTSKTVTGYTMSSFNNKQLGQQTLTLTYSEGGNTKTATAMVTVQKLSKRCSVCGTVYELDEQDKDNGCPVCKSTIKSISVSPNNITVSRGEALPVIVEALYYNGGKTIVTSWSSSYNPNQLGKQVVKITYQGLSTYIEVEVLQLKKTCGICGQEYSMNTDGTDSGCPYCRKEVVSIHANPEEITIEKYHPLPITVIATYRDGHTEEITDWAADLATDQAGTFRVTVSYKTVTDHITVTVLEEGKVQCPFCRLEYLFSDSPQGCPVCYYTVIGIEAALRNGGTTVLYKANLDLEVSLLFRDEHRELTFTGWSVTGSNSEKIGTQLVTVHYKEFTTQLMIEVVDNPYRVFCPVGHEYYLNEDGTELGCPLCNNTTSKDNAIFYFDTTYTEEILSTLYHSGIYQLQSGDYLVIRIKRRNVSILWNLQQMFQWLSKSDKNQEYTYGGEIK